MCHASTHRHRRPLRCSPSLADDLGGEGAEKLNGLFRASNARVSEMVETEPRVRSFPPAAADTGVGLFG